MNRRLESTIKKYILKLKRITANQPKEIPRNPEKYAIFNIFFKILHYSKVKI